MLRSAVRVNHTAGSQTLLSQPKPFSGISSAWRSHPHVCAETTLGLAVLPHTASEPQKLFHTESRMRQTNVSTMDPKCLKPNPAGQGDSHRDSLGASHCPSPLSALLLIPLALRGFAGSSLFQGAFPDLTQSRSGDPHRGLPASQMSPAETPLSSPSLKDPLNNRPQVSLIRVSLILPWLQHGCRLHMSPVWVGNEGFPTHPINLSNCCEPPPPPPVA